MSFEALGNLGDFVGGLAVVMTLIYVALEVRSNTRTVRASSAALSQDSLASINDLLASDGELAQIFSHAQADRTFKNLPPDQRLRAVVFLRANMQRFESMFFRYEAGLLEERVWVVRRDWLAGFLRNPLIAEWWESERGSSLFMPEFIRVVETVEAPASNELGQRPNSRSPTSA